MVLIDYNSYLDSSELWLKTEATLFIFDKKENQSQVKQILKNLQSHMCPLKQ